MLNSSLNELPWIVRLVPQAEDEYQRLDRSQQILVIKGLKKIARDPVGFGKELGNKGAGKNESRLVNYRSVRIQGGNLRIVWTAPNLRIEPIRGMIVAAVGNRSDEEVYRTAAKRLASVDEVKKMLESQLGQRK